MGKIFVGSPSLCLTKEIGRERKTERRRQREGEREKVRKTARERKRGREKPLGISNKHESNSSKIRKN